MANPYEERARAIKAYRLSRVMLRTIVEHDHTVEDVRNADAHTRKLAARVAGCRPPSDATWDLVCALLAEQIEGLKGQAPDQPPDLPPSRRGRRIA